jgi:predicted phage terminase large subunit-like protein
MLGGGDMFKPSDFDIWDALPSGCDFVRFWDKAATEGGEGAETAGVLMARSPDGTFIICDVIHGRWSAGQREREIKIAAEMDGPDTTIWIEQEPGSGGKDSAQFSAKNLAGYKVYLQPMSREGDKITRAEPMSAQSEVQNIKILRDYPSRRWNGTLLAQLADFPQGTLKDIVDAASGAFNKLALTPVAGKPAVADARRQAFYKEGRLVYPDHTIWTPDDDFWNE